MKIFLVLNLILLSTGCAQLMNGQMQPVTVKDYKQQIMFTTCSGTVEDWGSCSQKAAKSCEKGYEVLNRFESAVGGRRELTFQCKK
jgi:hypothetical protein